MWCYLKVMIVMGARPQFIKSAPVIHEFLRRHKVDLQLIHSGQHYDYELSQVFFEEMRLPPPLLDLKVGSGSHAIQTGKAMVRIERCIQRTKPDLALVPGDTNTTLAAALSAAKLGTPIGHIEAGARSYDMTMPEEINRRLTDHVSSMLFAPTRTTVHNLYAEGIPRKRVHLVGDTMVDALLTALPAASKLRKKALSGLDVHEGEYIVVTAHRPGNVDIPRRLNSIVGALVEASKRIKILFPAHPRIYKRLKSSNLMGKLRRSKNVVVTRPIGYLELVALLDTAAAVLTDSGGIQKEAFLLGVPCATMRRETEWPETVEAGANVMVDADKRKISAAILRAIEKPRPRRKPIYARNPFGDGRASIRIVDTILRAQ